MSDQTSKSTRGCGAICIIGMHRSGTSLIARLLNLRGLYLGPEDQMFGPNEGNPDGHFEHVGFLHFNEALLAKFGGSWDYPPQFQRDWYNDPALGGFVAEAKQLVESFPTDRPWGWKEPRTTLLLPFWQKIIPDLRFVICLRNPIDVANSLTYRNGMTIEHGGCLWNRYTYDALQGTRGCRRAFVFYDDLFVTAAEEVRRLAMFCELPETVELSQLEHVISANLRHHVSANDELLTNKDVAVECKLLYLFLDSLVHRKHRMGDLHETIDNQINDFLCVTDQLRSQERLVQLEETLNAKTLMLAAAQSRLDETSRQMTEFKQHYRHLQEHADRLQQFTDAVQKSLVYRFYRHIVRPLLRLGMGR